MVDEEQSAGRNPETLAQPLGDCGLLLQLGEDDPARQAALDLAAACERDALAGVTDVVAAFGAVAVFFDPAELAAAGHGSPSQAVRRWLADRGVASSRRQPPSERVVEIPVGYGGRWGADLEEVAEAAGLTPEGVVRLHAGAEYRVGAVGFAPGFAYLEGLPATLHAARRATPRTHVPEGSVAIGGQYTGVYPSASPGGWNLIGRTPIRLFDPTRDPPSLLRSGDRVRFLPVEASTFERLASQGRNVDTGSAEAPDAPPVLRVIRPGGLTTLQDLGRPGSQWLGVSPSGAMDARSLRLANLLAGNRADLVAIEASLVGPVLEAVQDTVLGLAGALPEGCETPRRWPVAAGERVDLQRLTGGARCYIAVAGGLASDHAFGGGATDLRAGFGGHSGRPLAAGDVLRHAGRASPAFTASQRRRWSVSHALTTCRRDAATALRVLRGPQADWFDRDAWEQLHAATFRITRESNRMGIRCEGPGLRAGGPASTPSQPVVQGAVQIPPSGQPIILGADRQTLGGYPVIACVASVDWPALGQLAPGDAVRFVTIDLEQAERLRAEAERELALAAAGIAAHS